MAVALTPYFLSRASMSDTIGKNNLPPELSPLYIQTEHNSSHLRFPFLRHKENTPFHIPPFSSFMEKRGMAVGTKQTKYQSFPALSMP